ncbi:hypothetical protein N7481_012316 [Penicillium waksmanii]|uniref:uncharacterized protein n=1 Tax=Penicillium waksmanii TaxID=69791 RepID=UPI0025466F76|nr:uncharacterized protein N7481_012316 [Penicillium waksmanii]KAJ5965602.1 hypothetical protein N7481_012316 [Penicillium waksmanii]
MLATLEIMERIFPNLPYADQVCFALSCKTTFACFKKFLALQNKTIRDILPHEYRSFLNFTYLPQPKTELVRRLENTRWKFCPQCLRLQQHSALRALKSKLILHLPLSSLDIPQQSPRRCSQLYAGEADVFPGLSITVRDKLDLIRALQIGGKNDFYEATYHSSNNSRSDHNQQR